jgi:hypothetical protein
LINRAENYITTKEDCRAEKTYVRNVLKTNQYADWALNTPLTKKVSNQAKETQGKAQGYRPMIGIPYIHGTAGQLARIYRSHGVHCYVKPGNTLRQQLVSPKDKTPKEKQCGLVYHIQCDQDPAHNYI